MLTSAWVEEHATDFDVMHVHFGFDALSPDDLRDVVDALRRHDKPLVLTVHDLRNPHHETAELHDAQLGVLVAAADALITLTPGAAATIRARWGRDATVLPHPQVVPDEWLGRARAHRATSSWSGLHAKSLRANMDPLPLVDALVDALPGHAGCPPPRGRPHRRHDRGVPAVRHRRSPTASAPWRTSDALELRVHDYFTDDELWGYLQGLDVSVLPYQFGTHSGLAGGVPRPRHLGRRTGLRLLRRAASVPVVCRRAGRSARRPSSPPCAPPTGTGWPGAPRRARR